MSQDEFLDWVQIQDGRWEYDGSGPVAMTNGTVAHSMIADGIRAELRLRLLGGPCRSMSPDGPGVQTVGARVRYPDATITCSPMTAADRLIPDPVIVFEVTSASTRRLDQVFKLREYLAVPSIRRYVLLEQTGIAITVHLRSAEGPWATTLLAEADTLALPEVGIAIPVGAIYRGVSFT